MKKILKSKWTWGAFAVLLVIAAASPSEDDKAEADDKASIEQVEPTGPTTEPPPTTPAPKPASYTARAEAPRVVNPATVTVVVTVLNEGEVAGTPECYVSAEDPSGTYVGYDWFTLEEPVAPGDTATFRGQLTVTKEGALWATETEVSCEEA